MPIRLLPPQLANQIAAGEVVERPASVVKELVENCIDAGATDIRIDIEKGGAQRIRIRDNGCGISKDELALALSRHATSKIASLDDLEAIMSLGFRGEALASISSVARLRLTSKPREQAQAWQAWCEGRDMQVQIEPAAHPDGSTIEVLDLFFNTPARRKFLRTEKTEFSHIDEVVRRIALAHPQISFTLSHNQQLLRQYRQAGNAAQITQRLQQIVGKRFVAEALQLSHSASYSEHDEQEAWQMLLAQKVPSEGFYVHGWVSPPAACRHQHDVQYMYVNGRMMKDKLLNHAVRQAYAGSLGDDRQPSFVLYFWLPAAEVDVNVHPAKHEVRFHQARQVHDFVLATLQKALAGHVQEQQQAEHHYRYQELQPEPSRPLSERTPVEGQWQAADSRQPAALGGGILPGAAVWQSPSASAQLTTSNVGSSGTSAAAKHDQTSANTEAAVSKWQCLSLLEQRYWLLQETQANQQHLFMVDVQQFQLLLSERHLAQQLVTGLTGQPLLLPVQVTIAAAQYTAVQANNDMLAHCGVLIGNVKKQGEQVLVQVQQVPAVLRHTDLNRSVPQLVQRLQQVAVAQEDEANFSHQLLATGLPAWLAEQGAALRFSQHEGQQLWPQFVRLVGQEHAVQQLLRPLPWQQCLAQNH